MNTAVAKKATTDVILIDTSVLVRLANLSDPMRPSALKAVTQLHRSQDVLHITPQNLIEFRSVVTRPIAVNGLGLSPQEATTKNGEFEALFSLLPDTAAIFNEWKRIVESLGVVGKQVQDARLIAACCVNGIDHILTFNTTHFVRIAQTLRSIDVVDPRQF